MKIAALMAEKKIKGRKRHIVVDTLGNLLAIVVHAANIHDTKSGIRVAESACKIYGKLKGFCADAGYAGTFVEQVKKKLGLKTDIVKRKDKEKWGVLAKRWIVERTFAWLNNFRGLSKDYELTTSSAESMIKLAFSKILLNRL